jgi:glycosyltransferase involved in cell wall biosynthesis
MAGPARPAGYRPRLGDGVGRPVSPEVIEGCSPLSFGPTDIVAVFMAPRSSPMSGYRWPEGPDVTMQAAVTPDRPPSRPFVVWFVNQYAGSPHHGMEFRHYELGRELAGLGLTVVVISGSYSHLFARQPAATGAYTVEDVDGLTYCWVRVPSYRRAVSLGRVFNMFMFMLRLYRLPTGDLPTPDAIVVSSPSLFPILPAQRWARRNHSRLIFEVRDIWPLTLQELGGLSARHPLVAVMDRLEARAYRVADAVVSVLPTAEPHYVARGMAPSKLHVIPNGASPDALLEPSTDAPANVRAVTSTNRFTVGFIGTLGSAAGMEALIAAARILASEDIEFVIVGRGSEEDRLKALAAGLPNVSFVGPVPKPDVPATLRQFDVCYIGYHESPLWRFGISPNKLFDYMAAGRPIILAVGAANDIIGDANCGATVPSDDPIALADTIRSFRAMPAAQLAQLGANGRAYVEREHTFRTLAHRYLAVLRPDAG